MDEYEEQFILPVWHQMVAKCLSVRLTPCQDCGQCWPPNEGGWALTHGGRLGAQRTHHPLCRDQYGGDSAMGRPVRPLVVLLTPLTLFNSETFYLLFIWFAAKLFRFSVLQTEGLMKLRKPQFADFFLNFLTTSSDEKSDQQQLCIELIFSQIR